MLRIVGIDGLISYAMSQRTCEIGICLTLGAQREGLRRMFLEYGLRLTGAGVIVGAPAAYALTRLMKTLLFNVSPLDPWTYAAVPFVLIVAAAFASHLPARRASMVDPIIVLNGVSRCPAATGRHFDGYAPHSLRQTRSPKC